MTRDQLRADAILSALRDLEADSDGRHMSGLLAKLDSIDGQFAPQPLDAAVAGQKMDTVPVSAPAPARRPRRRATAGQ